jgi:hypothetical protein
VLGFVDSRVAAGERAGEKIGERSGKRVGDNYAEEGGECKEANGFAVEEVRWWGEELGNLGGDNNNPIRISGNLGWEQMVTETYPPRITP